MAVTTLTVATATLAGTALSSSTSWREVTTAGTIVIDTTDFDKLLIVATNAASAESVAVDIESNSEYSSEGIGDYALTIPTGGAAIGGISASWEIIQVRDSARFKSSSGTLIFTITAGGFPSAGTMYWGALVTRST